MIAAGRTVLPFALAAILAGLAGCATDWDQVRASHVEQIADTLTERTRTALPADAVATLDDCIRIALANNLDVRSAEISQRLARLDRNIAFGAMLPQIDIQHTDAGRSKPHLVRSANGYLEMSDERIAQTAVRVQQPIFVPQAWLVYQARKKGEDIAALVTERTRQIISLQVTAKYYACLSQTDARQAIAQSLKEAETLADEVAALRREGLATESELLRVRTLRQSRANDLAENARANASARAALLKTMGLDPFADIRLCVPAPVAAEPGSLPEQILLAMRNRMELRIADRQIGIRKDQIHLAIADFLPNLVGMASYNNTSDSYVRYGDFWTYGLSGVMTVFDGFRNVFAYKAARKQHEQAFVDREQTCLSIMLAVQAAGQQVDRATEQVELAQSALRAAAAELSEARAQWREGLLTPSRRREAMAQYDQARVNVALAAYQQQIAMAALRDVLGLTRGVEQ